MSELKHYSALGIEGSLPLKKRNEIIDLFKTKESKILILTPQSSKEGLTLTQANHCIFYDRTFSLDDYLQAQDRIHRISQEKTCYIYNLNIENSIDNWIDKLVDIKFRSSQLLLSDIKIDDFKKVDYSFGEIIELILEGKINVH